MDDTRRHESPRALSFGQRNKEGRRRSYYRAGGGRRSFSVKMRNAPISWPAEAFWQSQAPNLSAARAFAFAASSSRFFGDAFVSRARRRRVEMPAISSTAASNAPSFAFVGLLKPLIFLTNWSEAARISSEVTGGSKLKRVLIFLHITVTKR